MTSLSSHNKYTAFISALQGGFSVFHNFTYAEVDALQVLLFFMMLIARSDYFLFQHYVMGVMF